MNEIRIPYKPKVSMMIFVILFFGGCTLVLGYTALSNDRGFLLNRIIELSEGGATVFYWCLTAVSGIFVLLGIHGVWSATTSKKEIVLTATSISSPKNGFSRKVVTVNYADISDLSIQTVQKQKFLNIVHPGGKLSIPQNMLPSKQQFEELTHLIGGNVNVNSS